MEKQTIVPTGTTRKYACSYCKCNEITLQSVRHPDRGNLLRAVCDQCFRGWTVEGR